MILKLAKWTLLGVAGLTVRLVDKNVGADQVLGTTQVGADGSYAFAGLPITDKYLIEHHKSAPHGDDVGR